MKILIAAALLASLFPLLNLFLIYPKYQGQMLESVKHEARQLAHHLSRSVIVDADSLRAEFDQQDEPFLLKDFDLIKIKVFDRQGVVIYSSERKDIGSVNSHDYFHTVVAQGQEYTKVVGRESRTAEGELLERDLVEIYLPVIRNGTFIGAFEVYYDITSQRDEYDRIYYVSLLYPVPLITLFIWLVGYILKQLDIRTVQRVLDKQKIEAQRNSLLLEQEKQRQLFVSVEKAKRQWEATMDRLEDMVILVNAQWKVWRCNKEVAVFCERPFSDILNQDVVDIFPGLPVSHTVEGKKPFEYRHEASSRIFSVTMYPISFGDEEAGIIVTLHDQTEIKKLTADLEAKNQEIVLNSQELQRAIDEISGLIQRVVVNEDFGTYFQGNFDQSCYEHKKCDKTDCLCYGKKPMRCWQQAGTFCGNKVQGKFASKYLSCSECSYFKAMTANPMKLIGEQFNNMMRVLEGKNKALHSAYTELKLTQSQLLQQEKMASVGQLAAGVAHEINNPVGFIASNLSSMRKYTARIAEYLTLESELIAEAGNPDLDVRQAEAKKKFKIDFMVRDVEDLVNESLEGCERVKKIVHDLKGFSRVDQAGLQTVDIHECLDSTINIAWNELKYKTKIEKHYQAKNPISCFPQQLNQVFMNLLVNAAHAIDKEGVIAIRTWQDDTHTLISISDTGRGMAPEIVGHIFEPFFTTKEVGKGTGLGLSIVYDIVTKNHHGDIVVESQVGQGSTFTVKIPFEQLNEAL